MTEIKRLYVDGGYGQIHVRIAAPEAPTKQPLYCLHQSPKHGGEFEAFMVAASADRIIVAPDYPGYGMSVAPPQESDASIEMYASCCWQVADALGHETVDLFGNHTGGKVATEMALQHPDRASSIVMISAAIFTDDERKMFSNYFTPIPLDEAGTRFTTMWERIVERRRPNQSMEWLGNSFAMNLMGGEAYEWGHVAAFKYGEPFENALAKLPHQITVLNPDDDLTEATRRAGPLLNNGEVIELPKWGYGFLDMFTEEATKLILSKL